MTQPGDSYRVVAGLAVPLPLVSRLVTAICARYSTATAGISDPDAAVRAALKAWIVETLVEHEAAEAVAPLTATVAQTVTHFEDLGKAAKAKAIADAATIVEPSPPPAM